MDAEDECECDEDKPRSNLDKHGVDFADALVFDWSGCLTREDDDAIGERRFVSIGAIYGIFHALTRTDRDGVCRIIGLRKAARPEIKRYEG